MKLKFSLNPGSGWLAVGRSLILQGVVRLKVSCDCVISCDVIVAAAVVAEEA